MQDTSLPRFTTFIGTRRLATGSLLANARAVHAAQPVAAGGPFLTFDDATGRVVDLDLRGDAAALAARYPEPAVPTPPTSPADDEPRGRGRPRLGVVAREVTLLPRHWDWLAAQAGGASVALRKLVDQARKANAGAEATRAAQERAYRFMSALAGNLPDFEEATRALFANEAPRLGSLTAAWPADVRAHALQLASPDHPGA